MKTLTISFCVLFLVMMSALPVSAEPELYFGDVKTLEDRSKIVSLMVRDVNDLGSSDAIIEFTPSEGVRVTDVTSGDGNALIVQDKDIDNIAGLVRILAWDVSTAHSEDVVICNIAYTGSDSNPFEIGPAELFDYTYNKIPHSGNNDIDRSTVNPTATKVADDSATSVATVSGGKADGEGIVVESTEIADETNGSSGEDKKGIPGFGLLTCLSVMLITVRLLREDK
ncbi:MAG: hypothetical protein IBX40_08855 [Methanosarcinales archaeon]|nr:hypothetical protein [Methanosarcinales archaeon]